MEENINSLTLTRCSLSDCMMLQKIDICIEHTSAKFMMSCRLIIDDMTINDQLLKAMFVMQKSLKMLSCLCPREETDVQKQEHNY